MAFDIVYDDYAKAGENGFTFNLILPDGNESDAKLTIIGDMSPEVQNYAKQKYREYKTKTEAAKRRGKEWDLTLEEVEEDSVEACLVRLVSWEGFTENGKVLEFSKDKAAEILKTHAWIRKQILSESENVLNFTPTKKKKT